ncbi:MAG: UDP-N-acetylmuramoyl-L-alanyl-D-glutamate--2,6-diaminopimelate ligase [Acidobacteriota bacterium]|nr:UDP-N-acetylmuramoyl-L-alanyl-D-glutamate--2,6-diaminopimelate ligase [Acidobacteriota bacterium]
MRVSELIRGTPIMPTESDFEVSGLTHDSRRVVPGDLFVAIEGENFDGRDFARDACRGGAVGVVGRGPVPAGISAPWLSVDDPRAWLGPLAARIFGHPDRQLTTVGVTGTNGKTTVISLLRSMLEAAGRPCAAVGTLGYQFKEELSAGERTTPEASDLVALLRRAVDAGASAAVMEVSSHALELQRVNGLAFDVALFTNLSRDHLDFHRDLESYFRAKEKLFRQLKSDGHAVVNVDDEFGRRLAGMPEGVLTFGSAGDVRVVEADLDEKGIATVIASPRGEIQLRSPLLGRFNLDNLLAAVAAGEALRLPHQAMREGVAECLPVAGRMEPVGGSQPFPVFVDYAHTDRALAAALTSLREFSGRRIMVVFGCGGDRDAGKRRLMGRVAGDLADLAIASSDNPRKEDPRQILREIEVGLQESRAATYEIVEDRRAAIRRAIALADEEWAVLVAGKGHEDVQILRERRVRFSDRREIELALEERFGRRDVG